MMFSPIVRRCRKEENIVIFREIGKLEAKAESFEMIEGKNTIVKLHRENQKIFTRVFNTSIKT